jgi:hypothetical protein
MNKLSRVKQSLRNLTSHFPLTRSFLIFSVLYFPVAILFLNRGALPEVILALYTLVLVVLGLILIARFLVSLASTANSRSGQIGSLFILYLINVLIPLLMYKVLIFVGWQLLPAIPGILCEITCFIKDLYFLFNVQETLSYVIVVSLLAIFLLTLWNTQKK